MISMTKEQFNRCMDRVVLEKLHTYHDFYSLMKYNDGIHPVNYLDSLGRLYRTRRIKQSEYKRILRTAHQSGYAPGEDMVDVPPVPHILDYDWRFSLKAMKHLCRKIRMESPNEKGTVVFMGTPSLWKYCAMHLPECLSLVLVDINASKHMSRMENENIVAIDIDIKSWTPKKIQADIIVMDPPWYFDYYRLFFDKANEMARLGTLIYCVMPPKYTRAAVEQETLELLGILEEQYGMKKVSYRTGDISYHTPPFEVNVLKAHGIECLPPNWRIGDLLVVQKTGMGLGCDENLTVSTEPWDEYQIDMIRVRIHCTKDKLTSYQIHLRELYKNNIFPSVKRSSNKKDINVWTSGNRVFWCDNIPLLSHILKRWGEEWIENDISDEEKECIAEVQTTLKDVFELEMKEYGMKWSVA